MRAAVFRKFGGPIVIEDVPDPAPSPGGAVIRVEATGLCRSDWHAWMGHDEGVTLPHVPGHELAGVVEAVGPEVRRWRPGDRVTLPFVCGCGTCEWCDAGRQQVCPNQFQPGFTAWGSFAELVAVDFADGNLVRLPESMDFGVAASLGCRFATAFRAVLDVGRVRAGEWVAVHGCGGAGLSAVMIAAAAGAHVVAIDVSQDALRLAESFGAAVCVDARRSTDVVAAVRDASGGGVHVSMDCLGSPVTCFNSVACLRRRGRHVQVGLLLADESRPPLPMDLVVAHELSVLGSHGMPAHRYPAMLSMIDRGVLSPGRLIRRTVPLDKVPTELPAMGDFTGAGVTVVVPE